MNKVNNGKTLWAGRPILGTSHRKHSMLFFISSSKYLREHAGSLRCCASQIVLMMLRPEWGRDCRPECSMLFFMNRKFSCCEGNVFQKTLWKMRQSVCDICILQKNLRVEMHFEKTYFLTKCLAATHKHFKCAKGSNGCENRLNFINCRRKSSDILMFLFRCSGIGSEQIDHRGR